MGTVADAHHHGVALGEIHDVGEVAGVVADEVAPGAVGGGGNRIGVSEEYGHLGSNGAGGAPSEGGRRPQRGRMR